MSGAGHFFVKSEPMYAVAARARQLFGMPVLPGGTPHGVPFAGDAHTLGERPKLSASESEALVLYVQGNTTREVADILNVQYETAKTFLRRAREKYARAGRPASRRADLVRRAAEDGYLT